MSEKQVKRLLRLVAFMERTRDISVRHIDLVNDVVNAVRQFKLTEEEEDVYSSEINVPSPVRRRADYPRPPAVFFGKQPNPFINPPETVLNPMDCLVAYDGPYWMPRE